MKVTATENRLLWALRGLAIQHLQPRSDDADVLNSSFIRANRTAMELLVEFGHMILLSEDEHGGRWYEGRLVDEGETPNAFGQDVESVEGMDEGMV